MRCHEALDALLTADLADLGANHALESHLLECARCAAVAGQLDASMKVLAARHASRRRSRSMRRGIVIAALPIAAGLAWVAGSLVVKARATPADAVSDSTAVSPSVGVHLEPGQNAMVLPTSNPKVTVVWLY